MVQKVRCKFDLSLYYLIPLTIWVLLSSIIAYAVFFGLPLNKQLDTETINHQSGFEYIAQLSTSPHLKVVSDNLKTPRVSETRLFEDGVELVPAHRIHQQIRETGLGGFSHWKDHLRFSTSDNTDPRTNGREYIALLRVYPPVISLVFVLMVPVILFPILLYFKGHVRSFDFLLHCALFTGIILGSFVLVSTDGVLFWILLGSISIALIWISATFMWTIGKSTQRSRSVLIVAGNASLVLISLTVIIAAVEAALWVYERSEIVVSRVEQDADYIEVPVKNENAAIVKSGDNEETHQPTVGLKDDVSILEQRLKSFGLDLPRELLRIAQSRKELITMPSDMDRVKIEVENAAYAYRWHRAIHVHDQNHMRRTSPLPPPRKGVYRIMVVGDSLTYGYGIDENWTYSSLLDESLSKDYKIEVINLGVSGLQSEDIATLVPKYLPMLRPNLVVYGVCLNDFLPSGVGEYANNYAYQIPLSDEVKKFFTNRTRIMRMSQDGYNQLLLKLGLRNGFFEDILKDFNGYQIRFDRDVKNINNSVTNAGAQPVLAMVLDQFPDLQNGYRITKVAESAFRSAGMEVIEMTPYYRHFNGNRFQVSRWEGHPNEVANAIWAKMLEKYLRKSQMLNGYRKSD